MRKGIIVTLLALFTVFAMVGVISCGDKDDGKKGTTFTITKNLNWPAGAGTAPANPASVETDTAKKLNDQKLAAPADTQIPAGYVFKGWYTAATNGTKVDSGYVFAAAATIFAQWDAAPPAADKAKLLFNANGGTFAGGATWTSPEFDPDSTIDVIQAAFATAGYADPTRAGYELEGWFTAATGGTEITSFASFTKGQTTTIYAHWTSTETPGLPDFGNDVVEKVSLSNGFYAVYRFDLPAGAVWEDFEKLTVDYLIMDEEMLTTAGSSRAMRLMGPYTMWNAGDFTFHETDEGKKMAVASYNAGKNTGYIFDQLSNDQGNTIAAVALAEGVTVAAGQWFTLPYKLDGSRANGAISMPADDDTGPYYFGVGWTGRTNDDATIVPEQYIKNVTMVGYPGVANLLAKPAYFERDGEVYPAYTGYPTGSGNGVEGTDREIVNKADTVSTIKVTNYGNTVVEQVVLSNGFYAVYQFTIPADSAWEDYEKLTVDYMIEDEAMLTTAGSSRAMRLMGPYTMPNAGDFTFHETDEGKKMAVASYNAGKNTGYIFDQLSNDQGNTIAAVALAEGVTVAAGEWFTLPYKLDGSRANGAISMPADDATGIFYFGIGWTGRINDDGIVLPEQFIKEVKLVGYPGVDDLLAKPAIFVKDGQTYPAYTGYPTGTGNGVEGTTRKTVNGTFTTIAVTSEIPPPDPIDVTFSAEILAASGDGATVEAIEGGYTYTYGDGANKNYGNGYASFELTIPAGVNLAMYDTVTVTWTGLSGDVGYKTLELLLLTAKTGYLSTRNNIITSAGASVGGGDGHEATLTLTLDKDKAVDAEGDVILAFYIHASDVGASGLAGTADTRTSYSITDVTIGY